MLNAHTATRTFREMQFDVQAFLKALYDVMPAEGHEDKGVVEIKWADGSVDIVPTFELIRGICNSNYMQLLIGGVAELIPEITTVPVQNGKYYRTTMKLLIKSAPLKAPMREIGSEEEDLQIIGGIIKELVANDVSLPYDAEISKIKVEGSLTTSYCNVSDTAKIGNLTCEDGSLKRFNDNVAQDPTLDLSNVRLSQQVQVITRYRYGYDLSQWTQIGVNRTIRPLYILTGQFRFGDEQTERDWFRLQRDGAGINVAIPILSAYLSFGGVKYNSEYVRTEFTKFAEDRGDPLPLISPPGMTMLYPLKETSGYRNGHVKITILPPTVKDKDKVLTVQNVTGQPIVACNAWSFGRLAPKVEASSVKSTGTSFGAAFGVGVASIAAATIGSAVANSSSSSEGSSSSADYEGEIEALNYIKIPPYSAIDFLFTWSIKSKDRWEAYMLPMTSANLKVRIGWW